MAESEPSCFTQPAFDEPWQAEAYALVQVLIESGRITPATWADVFGAALRRAAAEGQPDTGDTYYAALTRALEQALVAAGRLDSHEIGQRVEDWREAYLHTPHGASVQLASVPRGHAAHSCQPGREGSHASQA